MALRNRKFVYKELGNNIGMHLTSEQIEALRLKEE